MHFYKVIRHFKIFNVHDNVFGLLSYRRTVTFCQKRKVSTHFPVFLLITDLMYCPCASLCVGADKQWTPWIWYKFSYTMTELFVVHLSFSISCVLYLGQMPPTHSLTPTQVRQKCLLHYEGQFPITIWKWFSMSLGFDLLSYIVHGKHWLQKLGMILFDWWAFVWRGGFADLDHLDHWVIFCGWWQQPWELLPVWILSIEPIMAKQRDKKHLDRIGAVQLNVLASGYTLVSSQSPRVLEESGL